MSEGSELETVRSEHARIERVGIIGAGTMGNGIAHVFARCGFAVLLCEVEQRLLDRGLETIKKEHGA